MGEATKGAVLRPHAAGSLQESSLAHARGTPA